MACYHPLHGYQKPEGGAIYFKNDGRGIPLQVCCGQCVGCLLERSRQWAVRCMHEASLYDDNCFLTLTYDDDRLPDYGSLVLGDFQKFMKRLRRRYPYGLGTKAAPLPIRYFHCGEYGEILGRPHYHTCVFGFDFPDKTFWSQRGDFAVYRSAILEDLWPFGYSEIGSVTFDSAAYVASYVLKKRGNLHVDYDEQYNYETGEIYRRAEEYVCMSTNPGIGKPWLDKYMCEVFPADSVVMRGVLQRPPKYYKGQLEIVNPQEAEFVTEQRRLMRNLEDNTPERLAVREEVTYARLNLKCRGGVQ